MQATLDYLKHLRDTDLPQYFAVSTAVLLLLLEGTCGPGEAAMRATLQAARRLLGQERAGELA